MAAPDRAEPNLHIGIRLVTILLAAILLYAVLLLFGHLVPHLDPDYWKAIDSGAVLLIAVLVAVLFGTAIRAYMQRAGQIAHFGAVRLIVNILIAMAAVAVLLSFFGISLSSLLVSSAFAGIVIGLAAQTVLANVLAGLLMAVASPFQEGERISVVNTGSYGVFSSTYPHETYYPTFTGVIESIELIYTNLRLDSGVPAKIPNQALLASLILRQSHLSARRYRVRMTFAIATPVTALEEGLAQYVRAHPAIPGYPEPHAEVADIGLTTWDGVVVVWSHELTEEPVRDAVMRQVLPRIPRPAAK
jgi:small conductance mechanosensitive channel